LLKDLPSKYTRKLHKSINTKCNQNENTF
jgi:hypothetical protein